MKLIRLITIVFLSLGIGFSFANAAAKWPDEKTGQPSAPSTGQASNVPLDVNFQNKLDNLMKDSLGWNSLSTPEKLQAVQFVIQIYQVKQNTAILKPANFYVERLNQSFSSDANMMSLPLPVAVKVVSVMEYDFYNGQDKDQLAVETLGPQLSEQVKKKRQEMGL